MYEHPTSLSPKIRCSYKKDAVLSFLMAVQCTFLIAYEPHTAFDKNVVTEAETRQTFRNILFENDDIVTGDIAEAI